MLQYQLSKDEALRSNPNITFSPPKTKNQLKLNFVCLNMHSHIHMFISGRTRGKQGGNEVGEYRYV
jgi:hypothetical protein